VLKKAGGLLARSIGQLRDRWQAYIHLQALHGSICRATRTQLQLHLFCTVACLSHLSEANCTALAATQGHSMPCATTTLGPTQRARTQRRGGQQKLQQKPCSCGGTPVVITVFSVMQLWRHTSGHYCIFSDAADALCLVTK